MEKRSFKVDIAVIMSVVIIGAILVAVFFMTRSPGKTVIVSVEGKTVATYPLDEDRDEWITGREGKNRLVIKDGAARIEEADCPDLLCVKQGSISNVNESIVCLPHRITVRVAGESESATETFDAVAR